MSFVSTVTARSFVASVSIVSIVSIPLDPVVVVFSSIILIIIIIILRIISWVRVIASASSFGSLHPFVSSFSTVVARSFKSFVTHVDFFVIFVVAVETFCSPSALQALHHRFGCQQSEFLFFPHQLFV